MRVILTVIAGPHQKGLEFAFDKHDTFLVGRSRHAHFQLPAMDKYFSRVHFMMEVNPPQCRLIDMGSHNGTYVNGEKVLTADLKDGDEIRAGHTVLRVRVVMHAAEIPTVTHYEPSGLPQVPGFQLGSELGRGAMGVTYLGRRVSDPTPLAIKVVQPSFQATAAQTADFLQAARFLTQLDHPHIVRVREVGVCPSGFYFASDHVAGDNVTQRLQRDGPTSLKRTIRWANHFLQALQYAHAKHFIHRDIKPSNVLITEQDGKEIVKLSDYGLARVYQSAPFSGLSLTAAMLDNASFIPPEVLFSYQEVNPFADQYSAAAIVYHLLTGAQLLEIPKEVHRRFSTLLRRQSIPIRERREDVPAPLADVIHRALARTPQQRFPTIGDFRKALIRSVQGD
jgi:serine/threonine protein kinase